METSAVIGRVLARRYRIFSFLGSGSMSTVYRATQADGPDVAVKLLRTTVSDAEAARERLFREAQVIARLDHPGCVRLLDWGVEEGSPFVVLELVEGESLGEVLRRRGTLPESEAAAIIAEVCPVLEAAHSLGVVHRDLKPGNIMLLPAKDTQVKVLDFGLARLLPRPDADETQPKELTRPGSTLGTPSYMAPEQVRGANVDGRADIYSCGVILFEMVAASLPIVGENAIDTMLRQATEAPRALRDVVPRVDESYAATVARCLSKSPLERYQNAGELRRDLAAVAPPSLAPETPATMRRELDPDPDQTTTRLRPLMSSPPGLPPPKMPPPPRRAGRRLARTEPVAQQAVVAPSMQRESATQLRASAASEETAPVSAADSKPTIALGESKTKLPLPSAPKIRVVDREATQVRGASHDVTDFESTIPAVRPSSPGTRAPVAVLDPEATVPAVYPKGPPSADGTTRVNDLSHWEPTRKMNALSEEDSLVDTGTLVRVAMPSPSPSQPGAPSPLPPPPSPSRPALAQPASLPPPVPRVPQRSDASASQSLGLVVPPQRPLQTSSAALAEVLSGMPRDERRWLIAAAAVGVAAALVLALWLLL
jgi:serine/threonine protein kinase